MERIYRVDEGPSGRYVLERDDGWHALDGNPFDGYQPGHEMDPAGLRFLPPVLPSKIVAVGLNYKDHAAEQNKPLPREPLLFLKPSTAVVGHGDDIILPAGVGRVDHEAEVGVVIRRRAHRVSVENALDYVLGVTCLNDVTARDLQNKGVQYSHCKGFDTFAPIGPCIAIGLDGGALEIEGWVNDQRRQSSSTRELIFSIPAVVAYISAIMTLLPGDVIATGTPAGIGPLRAGDRVTIRVHGVGDLQNGVVGSD